jgi:hypothetical protein
MVDTAKTPQILQHLQHSLNLTVYDTKYVAPRMGYTPCTQRPRASSMQPPCRHAAAASSAHRTTPRSTTAYHRCCALPLGPVRAHPSVFDRPRSLAGQTDTHAATGMCMVRTSGRTVHRSPLDSAQPTRASLEPRGGGQCPQHTDELHQLPHIVRRQVVPLTVPGTLSAPRLARWVHAHPDSRGATPRCVRTGSR